VSKTALDTPTGVLSTEENVRFILRAKDVLTKSQATVAMSSIRDRFWPIWQIAISFVQEVPTNTAALEIDWRCTC
jgi:hypothetical protein